MMNTLGVVILKYKFNQEMDPAQLIWMHDVGDFYGSDSSGEFPMQNAYT